MSGTVAIIVALISFAGTALGAWFGVLKSNQLVNYRIDALDKKVEKLTDDILQSWNERILAIEKQVERMEVEIRKKV